MSRETINAQRIAEALEKMGKIEFALVVGGYAHSVGEYGDGFEYIVSKPWKYLDEIAEWLLEEDQESAVESYNLMVRETCQECYSMTDKYEGEIEHSSDCSQGGAK